MRGQGRSAVQKKSEEKEMRRPPGRNTFGGATDHFPLAGEDERRGDDWMGYSRSLAEITGLRAVLS